MTSKEQSRHTELSKPNMGNFNQTEFSILGTKCEVIKTLADKIITALAQNYKCAYIDTSHNDKQLLFRGNLADGVQKQIIQHKDYYEICSTGVLNRFQYNQILSFTDLVLVNGNHQQANAQVVIIDKEKKESLQKRLLQLNNVKLILLTNKDDEIFDFIKNTISYWQKLPVFYLDEIDKIVCFFIKEIETKTPKLNGLVLAGGKSSRMGFDKSSINWHGKEQKYHIADLIKDFCSNVYISCRNDQIAETDANYNTLADTFTDLGPYGAILSAFRKKPDAAWLVVASDLPLLTKDTINELIKNRNCSSIATTFESPFDNYPEPLITIWEPKSYPVLLYFLSLGISCPRKVLINNDTNIIKPIDADTIININTPIDAEKIKSIILQKSATD